MNAPSILTHPVTGEVGPNGHLIRADEALRNLHLRAGGIDGGTLAIPQLLAIATLTQKLKMRLARNVHVAQGDDDFDLWVETSYYEGVVALSIHGWCALPDTPDANAKNDRFISGEGMFTLEFDQHLRLIASHGELPSDIGHTDFGLSVSDIFGQHVPQLRAAMAEQVPHREKLAQLFGGDNFFDIEATPVVSDDGRFNGYVCAVSRVQQAPTIQTQPVAPSVLFAQQLAPALRQPLGRIIANAETIGSKLQGPIRENYALYAKDIADAARHLITLVDDLGDLEAVERSDFTTARDAIELGDVARRVAGLLALKAADHQITIIPPPADQKVHATAEFRRVLQILLNLVTNAVRYSPDGTTVTIVIAERGNISELSVLDQGAGISDKDQEKVFAKFERLGRTGDGGSGLGLYISRRLARFMGGDLTIEPSQQDGAKFTLTLPKE